MKGPSLSGLCRANYRTGRQTRCRGGTVISLASGKEEECDAWGEGEIMAALY